VDDVKRWAIGLALATVALCAMPARADDSGTSCQDICIEGCANACSSVCRIEGTRETCEIRCNPACYSACEPRCATPSCGEACAATCASRCGEDDASVDCPNRCGSWCGRICDDGWTSALANAPTTERRHHDHEPGDNGGWCPGQVALPGDHTSSETEHTSSVDPDAPGTVAVCSYAPSSTRAPSFLALLGAVAAVATARRRKRVPRCRTR
jgi:hypothetical protein